MDSHANTFTPQTAEEENKEEQEWVSSSLLTETPAEVPLGEGGRVGHDSQHLLDAGAQVLSPRSDPSSCPQRAYRSSARGVDEGLRGRADRRSGGKSHSGV